MNKLELYKPTLIVLYGFPGSGKTFVARQLCQDISAAHIQGDRIRYELFEQPRYDRQENEIITHLMQYMAEEFLNAGISVVYDTNAARPAERRQLRDMARKSKAETILVWLQIDVESAFARVAKRDRRRIDERYASSIDRMTFDSLISDMHNPALTEDYTVISGKHNYQTQRNAIVKKLYNAGLITTASASAKTVKPGLVNLIPTQNGGRVDITRRNITIR